MRISLRVLGLLWLGLFLIIGSLLYNAYSKLKPETFVALITEQVQKNYPGSKLQVEKVSYGFSLDFNLNLQNVSLRRAGRLIGSIGELELKVPWWLLLTDRGNAQINLTKLDIFVEQENIPSIVKSNPAEEAQKLEVSLPSYLADAKFTIRAKEVSIRAIEDSRRYITVSKLLVREFQYGKNSAFEVNIPIEIKHNGTDYNSDLWLFGDVTPEPHEWLLNYRGEFRTRESNDKFQIEDVVIHGKSSFRPQYLGLRSEVELLIEKESIGKGLMTASQEDFELALNFTRLPMNYLSFVYEETQNDFLKKFQGEASGTVKFRKDFETNLAKVEGKLSYNGQFDLPDSSVTGKWQIGFENARWEISFISPKGEVSFFRRSVVDLKKNKVIQYNQELGFTGFDLTQMMMTIKPLTQLVENPSQQFHVTIVSCKRCTQGEEKFNANFKYGLSPDQKFFQSEIVGPASSFKMNFSAKAEQRALDITFDKFHWQKSYQFLSPYFNLNSGVVDGKLSGRWGQIWEEGQWLLETQMLNPVTFTGKMADFITTTLKHFDKSLQEPAVLNLNLSVRNNTLALNSLLMEDSESIKINGSLSAQQTSSLTLTFPRNKKLKPVKKDVAEPYWMNKEKI